MRRTLASALLTLTLMACPAEARLRPEGFDGPPFEVKSDQEAENLLRLALPGGYSKLQRSRRTYRVIFETNADVARQFAPVLQRLGATAADLPRLGGRTIADDAGGNNFSVRINLDNLKEEAQRLIREGKSRRDLATEWKIQSLMTIAHEATHALQVEEGKSAFGSTADELGLYPTVGVDKYDEYEAHVAEAELSVRDNGRVPEGIAQRIRDWAIGQVNANYNLPEKYLLVRRGRVLEGRAPFAWPGGAGDTADRKVSISDFVSAVVGLPAAKADEEAGTGGEGETVGDEELAQIQGELFSAEPIGLECAGTSCGNDPQQRRLLAGGGPVSSGTAEAKTSGEPKPRTQR